MNEFPRMTMAEYTGDRLTQVRLLLDRRARPEISALVANWSLVYALLTIQQLAPQQAEAFARDLQLALDAGDAIPEWAWQWTDEIDRGETPTLPFLRGGTP